MDVWLVALGVFFVLLPIVLMIDFWGDERLDARGRPLSRRWVAHSRRAGVPGEDVDAQAVHDRRVAERGASRR